VPSLDTIVFVTMKSLNFSPALHPSTYKNRLHHHHHKIISIATSVVLCLPTVLVEKVHRIEQSVASVDLLGCGRFADRRYADNVIKTAFHDTAARMSVSWNAIFMQLYVSAKRPTLSA